MPAERGGDLVSNALVWPALSCCPTAKQQDASRQQTEKATRCTVAACYQPDLFNPFTPPLIRQYQVGGTSFIYLCFINLNTTGQIPKCVGREVFQM